MDEQTFKKLLDEALDPLQNDIRELKDVQENRLLPSIIETETTSNGWIQDYRVLRTS